MKNCFSEILMQVGLFTKPGCCKLCEISKNTFFYRTPLLAALWFESEGDATEYLQYA